MNVAETDAVQQRRDLVREQVKKEFPPKSTNRTEPSGIGKKFRQVREAKGMTWLAVAQAAGIPDSGIVRAIEEEQDAQLSNLESIAELLGLRLDVTDAA